MNNYVLTMGITRLIYSILNLIIAILIFKSNNPATSLRLNSFLGAIGPFVFIFISAIGLSSIASEVQWWKLGIIGLGIALIMYGTKTI